MRFGHLEVFVTDPERSRKFYRDILGFEVVAEVGPYTRLKAGGAEILLRPVTLAGPGGHYGAPGFVPVLYTEDLDGIARMLTARGLILRPVDNGCLSFADPDGNRFQLVDPTSQ